MGLADRRQLQTISVFARAVGLSTSALRQYGETSLIAPAAVEERTGYRYYGLDQQQRAIWIRRLRDAGLRLERIMSVLESDSDDAAVILDDWLADAQERSASIAALVSDLKSTLQAHLVRNPTQRTSVRFDPAVLSAAFRQLGNITDARNGEAGFDGVLIEVRPQSVGVIATDRYILLARMSVPGIVDGPPARVRLSTSAVGDWLRGRHAVELSVEVPVGRDLERRDVRAWLRDTQGDELMLPQGTDRFPDVHQIVDAIEPATGRALFARDAVLRVATEGDALSAFLACNGNSARLTIDDAAIDGQGTGTFSSLELSGSAVRRIAKAAVGDELTCDVSGPGQPLVWRAPSQPDFVALMMPRAE